MRIVVVSNRLPVAVVKKKGKWTIEPSSGGLVSALSPVLKERGGVWVGWPGSYEQAPVKKILSADLDEVGYCVVPVMLSKQEVDEYYYGFSNETLWPLFHSLLGRAAFNRSHWIAYEQVNARFARAVAPACRKGDFIWVQDYQLLLVGRELRELGIKGKVGFFLHIPFPSPDMFMRLPWRKALLESMLQYDLIGFQTNTDRKNFIQCVKILIPSSSISYNRPNSVVSLEGRARLAGAFPIGIDFTKYNDLAKSEEVEKAAWLLHEKFPEHKLIVGVDRLDYTKGIPQRFEAFESCLEKYPRLRQKISLIQVVVPSRMEVPEYQAMKKELDELVGRINGRFTVLGWVPIHYIFGTLSPVELVAHYRSCEIALITPLNDGMNLVAKEYCASCTGNDGVLILSEFAGAAAQLKQGAILVNPYDVERTADAIYRAFTMPGEEKKTRMRLLRTEVRRNDVFRWVDTFLDTAESLG
jgi:trehalose 6-phosphate synthase/phosphatase